VYAALINLSRTPTVYWASTNGPQPLVMQSLVPGDVGLAFSTPGECPIVTTSPLITGNPTVTVDVTQYGCGADGVRVFHLTTSDLQDHPINVHVDFVPRGSA